MSNLMWFIPKLPEFRLWKGLSHISLVIEILWKFWCGTIRFESVRSLQIFAHTITAQLSRHVLNKSEHCFKIWIWEKRHSIEFDPDYPVMHRIYDPGSLIWRTGFEISYSRCRDGFTVSSRRDHFVQMRFLKTMLAMAPCIMGSISHQK